MKKGIEPMGYSLGRILTEKELEQVGGAGRSSTLTGGGGGVPGPIRGSVDGDADWEW